MKDISEGKIISEFVGLKSKIYSLITVNDEVTKAKGIMQNKTKNLLMFCLIKKR